MSRVIVIGAGVAGLATAGLLARDGHQVAVVEKNSEVGGRVGSWEREGWRFDTGPSWYLMPECFEHFFALMGTRVEDHLEITQLDPAYRVFGEGYREPLDLRTGRDEVIALFESVEAGGGEAIAEYLDSARETYAMATQSFLYTTFSRIPLSTIRSVAPRAGTLSRLLLESLQSRVERTVSDRRLQQVLGYPAVFLAATPRTAPSMYHLMSAMDMEDGVGYPQGGFTRLVEVLGTLARDAGATIHLNTNVEAIRTAHANPRWLPIDGGTLGHTSRVTGVRVRTDGPEGARTLNLDADVVVSCADLHHTETQLLPPEARSYPQDWWDQRTPGPGAVLALLGVEGRLPELAHHNLFFTADWDQNFATIASPDPEVPSPASTYVCMPSATDSTVAPAGCENLFVLIPVSPDASDGRSVGRGGIDGTGDPQVEKAVDEAIAMISEHTGVTDLAERIRVRRSIGPADFTADYHSWRGGALGPAHTLRQSAFLRGSNRSRRVNGLLYAGATTVPGVGLPMCLISAENVLKRIRGDHSDGPTPISAAPSGAGAAGSVLDKGSSEPGRDAHAAGSVQGAGG